MSKITTADCIKAICEYWRKEHADGKPLPHLVDKLIDPKQWKRVKKSGNEKTGFVRLFSNKPLDKACKDAGATAARLGRVDMSDVVSWVMVVRSTDEEINDVAPGVTINGDLVAPEEFDAKLRSAMSAKERAKMTEEERKDDDVREELAKSLGFKPASYKEMFGDEPAPKEEEAPVPPLVPGGAIVEIVNEDYVSLSRDSQESMDKEAKEYGKLKRQALAPGAKIVVVDGSDLDDESSATIPVEFTITFPKGGTAYAYDFGEGLSCDTNIWVKDDVGNIWSINNEPADLTDDSGDYIDLEKRDELMKRTGGTILLIHA